jgi:23S rRNA A2030 N6-methylase RlmJ
MANCHYGKIGDVWKHLPLAEILSIEKPSIYWESHAGSAEYPFTHSADRDYGVFYFMAHAKESCVLEDSSYYKFLSRCAEDKQSMIYPGAALIAMSLLTSQERKFLFCDIDEPTIANIKKAAGKLGITDKIMKAKNADGVSTVYDALSALNAKDASKAIVHIDPYEPFETGENGLTSIDLFCQVSKRGVKTILWYGLGSVGEHSTLLEHLRHDFKKNKFDHFAHHLWFGEIRLSAVNDIYSNYNPGVFGCGILCSNLTNKSFLACEKLGRGLEQIYKSARLPDGSVGAINFTQTMLSPSTPENTSGTYKG